MILVLTGTHHQPFDRLVRSADALAAATGERVVVQAWASVVPLAHAEGAAFFAPEALGRLADAARVIVAHGGPGSLFLAWDRGRVPVVVPRRPEHGEHVDDHQLRFARGLGDRAVVVDDPADLAGVLSAHADVLAARHPPPPDRSEAFAVAFGAEVAALVGARRARTGLRARVAHLLSSLGSASR